MERSTGEMVMQHHVSAETSEVKASALVRGTTMIELLLVIAVLAVLASIAVPNYMDAQVRAKVSREVSDMRSIATALETYFVDAALYPPHGEKLADGTVNFPASQGGLTTTEYMPDFPLTSPVAYIISVPFDPFLISYDAFDPRYGYVETKGMVAIMQANGLDEPAAKLEPRYGGWRLYAAGPDRDRTDGKLGILYDPTNGTSSNGDLVRSQKNSLETLSADE